MTSMNVFIGIDLGSTTTKAVVLDTDEKIIGRGITNSRSNYDVAAAAYFTRAGYGWTFIRAKAAAAAALPRMLRKRAQIQRSRRVGATVIWRVMEPRWFALKRREKRFDQDVADVTP